MTDDMKTQVTVIIPTYRRPQLLRRAIKSVLGQTYFNLKVCIYDNASGDETADVVAAMAKEDPRISYHCHSVNIGGGENFKSGMQDVTTSFFSFLSDDDVLLPEFIEMALAGFEKDPDAMLSSLSAIVMTTDRMVDDVPVLAWPREGVYYPPEGVLEMIKKPMTWTSILFRKEIIDAVGILDVETGGLSDFDYELRAAIRFPIVISKQPGAIFFSHADSVSGRTNMDHYWPRWEVMTKKIRIDEGVSKAYRGQVENALNIFFCKILVSMAIKAMVQEQRHEIQRIAEVMSFYLHREVLAVALRSTGWLCLMPGLPKLIARLADMRRDVNRSKKKGDWHGYDYNDYLNSLES